ncbi:MAG TPA: GIY-YIG nuclease family protein [Ignavibacteriaceae bacterium]|nr:GIY-YIG nuclease family protein [Ignavibacteriaceae bacterium]
MYTVYTLYSEQFNKIYIGQTENIERRMFESGRLNPFSNRLLGNQ